MTDLDLDAVRRDARIAAGLEVVGEGIDERARNQQLARSIVVGRAPQLCDEIERLRGINQRLAGEAASTANSVERLCEVAHDAYESAAHEAGWVTQLASRKPWAEVPPANQAATRAMVYALLAALSTQEDSNG